MGEMLEMMRGYNMGEWLWIQDKGLQWLKRS